MASLANVLAYQEERLQQNVPTTPKEYNFLDKEIKYGILQITEALSFLHYSSQLIHRNICPQSILINKRGTWKLAGLEFTEKSTDLDVLVSSLHSGLTISRLPYSEEFKFKECLTSQMG
uniref:Protein kinase domain-containing protein n=1 Tax=Strigamia maritima TaxID=126957 RepID=T1IJ62_STRMM